MTPQAYEPKKYRAYYDKRFIRTSYGRSLDDARKAFEELYLTPKYGYAGWDPNKVELIEV